MSLPIFMVICCLCTKFLKYSWIATFWNNILKFIVGRPIQNKKVAVFTVLLEGDVKYFSYIMSNLVNMLATHFNDFTLIQIKLILNCWRSLQLQQLVLSNGIDGIVCGVSRLYLQNRRHKFSPIYFDISSILWSA